MPDSDQPSQRQVQAIQKDHLDLLVLVECLASLVSGGKGGDGAALHRAVELSEALRGLLVDLHYPRERALIENAISGDDEWVRVFHYRHDLAGRLLDGMRREVLRERIEWDRFCAAADTLCDLVRVLVQEEEKQLRGLTA